MKTMIATLCAGKGLLNHLLLSARLLLAAAVPSKDVGVFSVQRIHLFDYPPAFDTKLCCTLVGCFMYVAQL
jgi:hypothetical protein